MKRKWDSGSRVEKDRNIVFVRIFTAAHNII
jgi:hypothetical protein